MPKRDPSKSDLKIKESSPDPSRHELPYQFGAEEDAVWLDEFVLVHGEYFFI